MLKNIIINKIIIIIIINQSINEIKMSNCEYAIFYLPVVPSVCCEQYQESFMNLVSGTFCVSMLLLQTVAGRGVDGSITALSIGYIPFFLNDDWTLAGFSAAQ